MRHKLECGLPENLLIRVLHLDIKLHSERSQRGTSHFGLEVLHIDYRDRKFLDVLEIDLVSFVLQWAILYDSEVIVEKLYALFHHIGDVRRKVEVYAELPDLISEPLKRD